MKSSSVTEFPRKRPVFLMITFSFNAPNDVDRDCVAEAQRVYDLAYYFTGNDSYAENQRLDWLTGCTLSESERILSELE
jgi:hypothetical protein